MAEEEGDFEDFTFGGFEVCAAVLQGGIVKQFHVGVTPVAAERVELPGTHQANSLDVEGGGAPVRETYQSGSASAGAGALGELHAHILNPPSQRADVVLLADIEYDQITCRRICVCLCDRAGSACACHRFPVLSCSRISHFSTVFLAQFDEQGDVVKISSSGR
jgi:hypothetical protein